MTFHHVQTIGNSMLLNLNAALSLGVVLQELIADESME